VIGWKIRVRFTRLAHRVRPKDHIEVLRPFLPTRYAPLQTNGNGIQSVYLTELAPSFAEVLVGLIGVEAQSLIRDISVPATLQTSDDLDYWEHKIESGIESDVSINPTDREAIIRARRGQGLFKQCDGNRTRLPHHGRH
jgi:putative restriction endonuclease